METELGKAAKLLLEGDLEACHEIAQRHETPDGNYLHAVLHRKGADYNNSLYWYRRVGGHPILRQMQERFPKWTFEQFVEDCAGTPRSEGIPQQEDYELQLIASHFTCSE